MDVLGYLYVDPFGQVLQEAADHHLKKANGYGTDEDPLQNIRAAQKFGVTPQHGIAIRMNDKWHRIQRYYGGTNVDLPDEKLRDDILDIAVYAMIWLQLDNEKRIG